mmetsp:Transcript_12713/g.23834  ORF Transcript_12713/g.23834 Transcript_12713/m.23834 type:complete len:93 (+) Transcript_12713:2863-3141(+)
MLSSVERFLVSGMNQFVDPAVAPLGGAVAAVNEEESANGEDEDRSDGMLLEIGANASTTLLPPPAPAKRTSSTRLEIVDLLNIMMKNETSSL